MRADVVTPGSPPALAAPPPAAHGALVLSPRPFARDDEVSLHAVADGATIAEMLEGLEACGALDPALRPWVRVTAGDTVLDPHVWAVTRPRPGVTLFIDVAPMGGSNALKSLLQTVVTALAMVASYFFGPWIAAAVFIGGNLLVNLLVPIKQPEVEKRNPRYSLDGAGNAARPHDVAPIYLGRRRIYPPRCANWYTRVQDNVVYLRQMLQPGVGWLDRSDARLGQTPLSSYDGVNIRWNTKPSDGLTPIWFNRTPAEDTIAVPIKSTTDWVTRTAPMEADALSMDVAFLAGLYETKESSGRPKSRSVQYEFRYGPVGGAPASATPIPFGTSGVITYNETMAETLRLGYEWAVARGEYDIHCRRVTAPITDTSRIQDELTLICIRAFRDEPAVRDADVIPWIELELKATDQLNGLPNDFNFIGTSVVKQVTATGLDDDWVTSRNPADLFVAASYAPYSDLDLDEDERDFAALYAWRQLCAAQGWTCDLAESSELSVGELLQRCAAAGRARPTLDFGALSVVVDWEKAIPRQMFTPRNVSRFRGDLLYPDDLHGLRLRFANEDKDYADDILVVFALDPDGVPYTIDTASIYESLEIRDKTDPSAVELEGARILAERRLRPETFSFDQDLEYVTAREGARAQLMHHVALVGVTSARVVELVVDPLDVDRVGLVLDGPVTMVAGHAYDLTWRRGDDAPNEAYVLDVAAGSSTTVWFAAEVTPSLGPQVGDLVAITDHTLGMLDVIVDRITPKDGLKAEIACRAYAPELQDIGVGDPIPAYRTAAGRPAPNNSALIDRTPTNVDRAIDLINGALEQAGLGIEAAAEDGTLTPGEKSYVVPAVQALIDARTDLLARATTLGLAADAVTIAYTDAGDDLDAVLATMTAPFAWDDLGGNTSGFDGPDFSAAYGAAILTERNLQARIAGFVPDDSIDTPQIAPRAATLVAAYYSDSTLVQVGQTMSANFGNELAAVTMTLTGDPVEVEMVVVDEVNNNNEYYYYLHVDSTFNLVGTNEVNHYDELPMRFGATLTAPSRDSRCFKWLLTGSEVAAGVHTFRFYLRNTSGATMRIERTSVTIKEMKKSV